MTETPTTYYSRSALAEKLGVTLKELTQLLLEAGWLIHYNAKEWKLTAKGEFEGGIYRKSKKYGQYIVWPESVLAHAAITSLIESQITATTIAKHHDTSAHIINRLLADLGWLSAYAKGWQLTALGRSQGGVQHQHEDTGIPYVTWPRQILESKLLTRQVTIYNGDCLLENTVSGHNDSDNKKMLLSLNGHSFASVAECRLANLLYLLGLVYSYQRCFFLSKKESIVSEFYLPQQHIHIHLDDVNVSPSELAAQLERQNVIKNVSKRTDKSDKQQALRVIEFSSEQANQFDQLLPKALLQWDIAIL